MTFLPPIFFSPFDYILARDFVYEIFSKLVSNSPRYSIFYIRFFDPAVSETPRDQNFFFDFHKFFFRKLLPY